jgi:hypothetical protein
MPILAKTLNSSMVAASFCIGAILLALIAILCYNILEIGGDYVNEIWKPVVGNEDRYMVSSFGRIRSLVNNKGNIRKNEKLLSLTKGFGGYPRVHLAVSVGVRKSYSVHRLVAIAFIPNPLNLPEVNHKDESRTNNRVDNLEWCSRRYNSNYGTARERTINGNKEWHEKNVRVMPKGAHSKKSIPVVCVNTGEKFYNAQHASEVYGINRAHINSCCNGRRQSAGKINGEKALWVKALISEYSSCNN